MDTYAAGKDLSAPEFTLLDTDPGIAGQANDFTTVDGNPNTRVLPYLGFFPGTTPVNRGACSRAIELANARLIGVAGAGPSGSATLTRQVPPGVAGSTVRFQALDLAPCETSNVTVTTFQ